MSRRSQRPSLRAAGQASNDDPSSDGDASSPAGTNDETSDSGEDMHSAKSSASGETARGSNDESASDRGTVAAAAGQEAEGARTGYSRAAGSSRVSLGPGVSRNPSSRQTRSSLSSKDHTSEGSTEELRSFLEEHDAEHLFHWMVESLDVRSPRQITTRVRPSQLQDQGLSKDEAEDLLKEAADMESSADSASASDRELLTELERKPAGDCVEQIEPPKNIRDIYCFLEPLHRACAERCVFLCEMKERHVDLETTNEEPEREVGLDGIRPGRAAVVTQVASLDLEADTKGKMRQPRQEIVAATAELGLRRCIVKVWRKDSRSEAEEMYWLRIQLKLLKMERHSNVRLPRRILEDQRAYYVEFDLIVTGCSLLQMVLNDASTTERQVKRIIRGVLRGLAHLHNNGLVHRDIKPENVMIEMRNVEPRLAVGASPPIAWRSPKKGVKRWGPAAQFKTAWARQDVDLFVRLIDLDTVCEISQGQKGAVLPLRCGTLGYMAPEAYVGFGGVSADLWGVGILMYLMMRCEAPFHAITFEAMRGLPLQDKAPLDVMKGACDAIKKRVAQIQWDGEPWSQLPLCRDLCRLLLHQNPVVRGADAADVLAVAPWFQRSSTAVGNQQLAHLRTGNFEDDVKAQEWETEKSGRGSEPPKMTVSARGIGTGRRGNVMLSHHGLPSARLGALSPPGSTSASRA